MENNPESAINDVIRLVRVEREKLEDQRSEEARLLSIVITDAEKIKALWKYTNCGDFDVG